ncbi:hypothetical protein GE300_08120 [Rhodobacteraceae bacterium 2CG4]|uniref:Uncharacterized protein n=1 Tax=Halovulum marinum TaxID=2662447 RepID=A0A6L5YZ39_9RHOB|nr:hypothetical protein [Halovulum marinum]MSU89581.1 hypothetical protein [Halovulum marinum]
MIHRLLGALLCAATAPAAAQTAAPQACGERAAVIERLRSGYGEERTGAGLSSSRGIVEVYASQRTGSWTILLTLPDGRSCLVAAGESWQSGPPPGTVAGEPV